jgi:tRNA modification GTPase
MEAYIDFPDEDIPETVLTSLDADTQRLQTVIQTALQDGKRGERVRDGISVVILGAPNAGKSSLLNAMARRDAAIVSTRAGTTRDIIEVHLDIAGFPVILVDTAGIRDSSDDIEEEGVRRALARSQTADIRLVLYDGAYWPSRDAASDALLDDSALMVVNKSDALPTDAVLPESAIAISARTGQGVDHLLREVEKRIITFFCGEAAPFITQNRHRQLLSEAFSLLEASRRDLPLELKCEELRRAAQAVGKITGKIQVDDVLDVLFRQFCIGK